MCFFGGRGATALLPPGSGSASWCDFALLHAPTIMRPAPQQFATTHSCRYATNSLSCSILMSSATISERSVRNKEAGDNCFINWLMLAVLGYSYKPQQDVLFFVLSFLLVLCYCIITSSVKRSLAYCCEYPSNILEFIEMPMVLSCT